MAFLIVSTETQVALEPCIQRYARIRFGRSEKSISPRRPLKTVKGFETLLLNPGVSLLTSALMGGDAVSVFLAKLSECDWTIKDVMKGTETSKAIVGFNYVDKMVGTIEMAMIKEDKLWKIDDLNMPKFEKVYTAAGK